MPVAHIVRQTKIKETARAIQLRGLFDVPPDAVPVQWDVSLPLDDRDWNIGLIVGPSGCGKTTIARELFGSQMAANYEWPADKSIVDGFPEQMGIKEITGLLSSVGFSSPPSWLRPFGVLSNGEQFRATIARVLAEQPALAVVDEFTSVVDRTVAQIGSAAIARAVRARGQKFIAVACHYDIEDWLQPDWVYMPATNSFAWRLLRRRPPIDLQIVRVKCGAWGIFKKHHYLDTNLSKAAKCWMATVAGRPAAFASAVHCQSRGGGIWREHRTVCLPDFQGVGIGNALSEYVAGLMKSLKGAYFSTTGSPAMISHRNRSPLWKMICAPKRRDASKGERRRYRGARKITRASNRLVASFRFLGPPLSDDAIGFGLSPARFRAAKTTTSAPDTEPGRSG